MARSRSSFDLDHAVATAVALTPNAGAKKQPPRVEAGQLVSFSSEEPPARPASTPPSLGSLGSLGSLRSFNEGNEGAAPISAPSDLPPSSTTEMAVGPGLRSALPPSLRDLADADMASSRSPLSLTRVAMHPPPSVGALGIDSQRGQPPPSASGGAAWPSPAPLPRLPDLSAIESPLARCERLIAWIGQVTAATDVFLADAAGLPIAGARQEETRLAASGWIAAAAGALAKALPGAPSGTFELHLGEGPFFQVIGFQVRGSAYVVGMVCPTPLTPRQAGAIRLACLQALRDTLGGVPG